MLNVMLSRLRRWYTDGLLCIGDAAHAMSPVGGVGINLAVQDAVAAGRILAEPLLAGRVSIASLRKVQRRRWLPTVLKQAVTRAPRRYTGQHCRGRSRAEADDCPRPAQAYATFSSFTGDSWLLRGDRPATRTCTRLRKASLVGLGCSFHRTKPQMRPCTGRFRGIRGDAAAGPLRS